MHGLRIREYDDHLFCALSESSFDCLRHMDLVSPLLRTDGVPVQCVNNRIAARFLLRVTGREKDKNIAIDRVPSKFPSSAAP